MTKPCPGPLPSKKPRNAVPHGACDTHFHVIGPYDQFPLVEPRFYSPPEAGPAQTIAHFKMLGFSRAVVVQATVLGNAPEPLLHAMDTLNEGGIETRGVASLPLGQSRAALDALWSAGVRGQRVTGLGKGPMSPEEVQAHADMIAGSGWHLDFLAISAEEWARLLPKLRDLPVPLVIDHMASRVFDTLGDLDQPGFQGLLDLVKRGNTWVKASSAFRFEEAPYPSMSRFVRALLDARPDRILWASDWPHVALWDRHMVQTADLVDWLWDMGLDDATRAAVLVDNPATLFGFETETRRARIDTPRR